MQKYAIWDKQSDIYTLGADKETGKMHWTAEEYITAKAPWASNPNVNVIVSGGNINGLVFMDYDAAVDRYVFNGMVVPAEATPQEVVLIMEQFEKEQAAAQQAAVQQAAAKEAEYAAASLAAQQTVAGAFTYQNMMNY